MPGSDNKPENKWSPDLHGTSSDEIFYTLTMFPYPSGSGLHLGHASVFAINDVVARYQWHKGKEVLNPIGFDSFGLPTENYAMKVGIPAYQATDQNTKKFLEQITALDLSFDMERVFNTSDPSYYKWTQRIFLQLFKEGLAYRDELWVNRCPSCQTVLANDQVEDGQCERCKAGVIQKKMPQRFIKITDYADRLLEDLDIVDWPEETKTAQRNWIGRSEGAEIDFFTTEGDVKISVFTTRPDTLYGVTALVLAPENTRIDDLMNDEHTQQVKEYRNKALAKTAVQRQQDTKDKTGVFSGVYAKHPLTEKQIPIWFADYVLPDYATGSIMMVPAHDERDFAFAKKFGIEVKEVIKPVLPTDDKTKLLEKLLYDMYEHANEHNKKLHLIGGWLFEGYIDKTTRPHHDIDFRAPEADMAFWSDFLKQWGLTVTGWDAHPDYQGLLGYHPDYKKKLVEISVIEKIATTNEPRAQEDVEALIDHAAQYEFLGTQILTPEIDKELEWIAQQEAVTKRAHEYIDSGQDEECFAGYGILVDSGMFSGLTSEQAIFLISRHLEQQGVGKKQVTYKLRDWSVSRQRYWGSPIPIYYDESGNPQPISEDELPVELPLDVENYKPKGKSPLADHPSFPVYTDKEGNKYRRECDTLDTSMCSSFYFLRYLDPENDTQLIDPSLAEKTLPVDFYTGGKEHTVGHLLYSRFVHKFLYDQGYVSTPEPFQTLFHQGMVGGPDGRKMSKRLGNTIDPLDVIDQYGSDAVKTYLLFMGPLDQDKQWNDNALQGVKKFLDRITRIVATDPSTSQWHRDGDVWKQGGDQSSQEGGDQSPQPSSQSSSDQSTSETSNTNELETVHTTIISAYHETIRDFTSDIDQLKYNTAVSKLMILTNTIYEHGYVSREVVEGLAVMLSLFAPKTAQTLRDAIGNTNPLKDAPWPEADESKIVVSTIELPIQVNGKMRGSVDIAPQTDKDTAVEMAKSVENVARHIDGKTIKKIIFVPDKIINFIVG